MPETTIQQGQWCHIEIPSNDPENTSKFYSEVFGWKINPVPMGDMGIYHLYETPGGGGVGGGIWNPPEGIPRQMINYVNVEEIDPITAKAEANGGKVVMPTQEVPGIGWFSLIADPDGNIFGIWKQGEHA